MQYQRIDERVDNQIVLAIRCTKKIASVVQMNLDARIRIWPVRMILLAQAINCRINLHRVHVLRAPLQGTTHVVA